MLFLTGLVQVDGFACRQETSASKTRSCDQLSLFSARNV